MTTFLFRLRVDDANDTYTAVEIKFHSLDAIVIGPCILSLCNHQVRTAFFKWAGDADYAIKKTVPLTLCIEFLLNPQKIISANSQYQLRLRALGCELQRILDNKHYPVGIVDVYVPRLLDEPAEYIRYQSADLFEYVHRKKRTSYARVPQVSDNEYHKSGTKRKHEKTSAGFVYFIRQAVTDMIKIGCSNNPIRRRGNLQTASVYSLELEMQCKTTDCRTLEKAVHRRLKRYNVAREWFYLPPNFDYAALFGLLHQQTHMTTFQVEVVSGGHHFTPVMLESWGSRRKHQRRLTDTCSVESDLDRRISLMQCILCEHSDDANEYVPWQVVVFKLDLHRQTMGEVEREAHQSKLILERESFQAKLILERKAWQVQLNYIQGQLSTEKQSVRRLEIDNERLQAMERASFSRLDAIAQKPCLANTIN
jgi:hypothetical protein